MYQLINKVTGQQEAISERAAIAKYGADKVNAMMFGLDPDMSLDDNDASLDDTLDDCDYAY